MIVQTPNPVLTQKAKPIEKIDNKIIEIIDQMKKTLTNTQNPKGVGLAAPQIGISYRLFITRPRNKNPIEVFINPEILWTSDEKDIIRRPKTSNKKIKDEKRLEGCLSINNIWGHVNRSTKVRLKFLDEKGRSQEKEFKDFEATIIQHECDHLEGILFTRRVLEQGNKLYKIEHEGEEEKLVEIEI